MAGGATEAAGFLGSLGSREGERVVFPTPSLSQEDLYQDDGANLVFGSAESMASDSRWDDASLALDRAEMDSILDGLATNDPGMLIHSPLSTSYHPSTTLSSYASTKSAAPMSSQEIRMPPEAMGHVRLGRRVSKVSRLATMVIDQAISGCQGDVPMCLRQLEISTPLDDILGVDTAIPFSREGLVGPARFDRHARYLELSFAEIGGVSQYASREQTYQHICDLARGNPLDTATEAFVLAILANGSLLDVVGNAVITRTDLTESFSLFQTACTLMSMHRRSDSRVVAAQALMTMLCYAYKCSMHSVLPLLSRIKDLLDEMEVDGFSWAAFSSGTLGEDPRIHLHQVFWAALFCDTPLRLFLGKPSTLLHLVEDEVTIYYADTSRLINDDSLFKAMASLHIICVDIYTAFRTKKPASDMLIGTIDSLTLRIEDWRNRLAHPLRDLHSASPTYLQGSQDMRRAGVKLSCLYYELYLTVFSTIVSDSGSTAPLRESHLDFLDKLFGWTEGLNTRDYLSEGRLITLCLDASKMLCGLTRSGTPRRLLPILSRAQASIAKTSYVLSTPILEILIAVEGARKLCAGCE